MSDESDESLGAVLVEHEDAPSLVADDDTTSAAAKKEEEETKTEETKDTSKVKTETTSKVKEVIPEESLEEETIDLTKPHPINIVSIGTEENAYAFTFHQPRLQAILNQVPADCKVAIVSVVGAFRTGKSFLLSWFLRYLHALENTTAEEKDCEWYEQVSSLDTGFHWQAGSERDTTGIWMWSRPHILKQTNQAILLVDTQGMFDHETTMSLTASIFGFSTLLSSYQIYNVDKRIQEDNLQQLALFSEYAKTAMETDAVAEDDEDAPKPFQRMEFLVRDWQHFDDDDDEENTDYAAMEASMKDYFEKVVAERDAKDLKDTREQILSCFQEITCFGLCHPGFAATKKKFKGNAKDVEPLFLHLLDRFCHRVFDQVAAKEIHGRALTAPEFLAYTAAYAKLFSSGATFPEAGTLLEATESTNNTNAINMALTAYQREMDRVAGPHCTSYVRPTELQEESKRHLQKSLEVFGSIANFGSKKHIARARAMLEEKLDGQYEIYNSLNDGRDPLAGMEMYLVPGAVAVVSAFLRWLTDVTCSPYASVCRAASSALSHTSAVVMCFLFIVAATKFKQIKDVTMRLKAAFEVMQNKPHHKKD